MKIRMNRRRHISAGASLHPGHPPSARRGQALVEYVIMTVLFLSAVAILAVFLYTFKAHGGRILDLVASEYP